MYEKDRKGVGLFMSEEQAEITCFKPKQQLWILLKHRIIKQKIKMDSGKNKKKKVYQEWKT